MNVAHTLEPAYPPNSQRHTPPQLLISVQNQAESDQVLEQGIDVLDFKAPNDGPLAPVNAQLWRWAAARFGVGRNQPKLSAALGSPSQAAACAGEVPSAFAFAKMGIEGISARETLWSSWELVRRRLHPNVKLVAVAYADPHAASCLSPNDVFEIANEFGLRHLLIDTFSKQRRSSIQNLGWRGLTQIVRSAQDRGSFLTIAGSLCAEDATQFGLRRIVPDAFGIRGDVTIGPRNGRISADRVSTWKKTLARLVK